MRHGHNNMCATVCRGNARKVAGGSGKQVSQSCQRNMMQMHQVCDLSHCFEMAAAAEPLSEFCRKE